MATNGPNKDEPERRELENWLEYRKLVLSELERLNVVILTLGKKLDDFKEVEISNIKVQIAMLNVKAGVWGAVAGLIPVALMLIFKRI